MEKSGNIVRYTIEEIREMIARGESLMDWEKVAATTEAEIEAQSIEDGDDFFTPGWENRAVMGPIVFKNSP